MFSGRFAAQQTNRTALQLLPTDCRPSITKPRQVDLQVLHCRFSKHGRKAPSRATEAPARVMSTSRSWQEWAQTLDVELVRLGAKAKNSNFNSCLMILDSRYSVTSVCPCAVFVLATFLRCPLHVLAVLTNWFLPTPRTRFLQGIVGNVEFDVQSLPHGRDHDRHREIVIEIKTRPFTDALLHLLNHFRVQVSTATVESAGTM